MTKKTQQNGAPARKSFLAKAWDAIRATGQASVRVAYDKPWLRDSHA
jgi:hypothetical protein